eukprot:9783134-Alexandrium_andersonii.AAC.1
MALSAALLLACPRQCVSPRCSIGAGADAAASARFSVRPAHESRTARCERQRRRSRQWSPLTAPALWRSAA